jgi:hypothetical protein
MDLVTSWDAGSDEFATNVNPGEKDDAVGDPRCSRPALDA